MSYLKGSIGELKTTFWMWVFLRKKTYKRFHDIILPSSNGTTQIDHLIISKYGIFIIETKNKSGWIFGSAEQENWTQVVYKKKFKFQNPLKQVYRQKKVLASFFKIHPSIIHSVINFVGNSRFKTEMPSNVIDHGLSSYIKSFKKVVFHDQIVQELVGKIENHLLTNNLSSRDHLNSLKERHNSETTCPKCGARLVERMAKKGKNAGKSFLGCNAYPKCKYTKNL